MTELHVLFDAHCGLCLRVVAWLRQQPKYIPLHPIRSDSIEAAQRWPSLAAAGLPKEVVVVADTGEVYRGDAAWIMCLYALKRHRHHALLLARPAWRPLTRRAIEFISEHRGSLSALLARGTPPTPPCTNACAP